MYLFWYNTIRQDHRQCVRDYDLSVYAWSHAVSASALDIAWLSFRSSVITLALLSSVSATAPAVVSDNGPWAVLAASGSADLALPPGADSIRSNSRRMRTFLLPSQDACGDRTNSATTTFHSHKVANVKQSYPDGAQVCAKLFPTHALDLLLAQLQSTRCPLAAAH